jgi:hypothetical protein
MHTCIQRSRLHPHLEQLIACGSWCKAAQLRLPATAFRIDHLSCHIKVTLSQFCGIMQYVMRVLYQESHLVVCVRTSHRLYVMLAEFKLEFRQSRLQQSDLAT